MDFNRSNLFVQFLQKGIFAEDHSHYGGYNFCQHVRDIAGWMLLTFIMFYVAGWFIVFGIPPWLLYFFVSDFPIPFATDFGTVGANIHLASIILSGIVILIASLFGWHWVGDKLEDWKRKRKKKIAGSPKVYKTPWYTEAYEGYKKKFCPLVHIIDDDPKEE